MGVKLILLEGSWLVLYHALTKVKAENCRHVQSCFLIKAFKTQRNHIIDPVLHECHMQLVTFRDQMLFYIFDVW